MKAALSYPSTALAWWEWSSRTGVTMVMCCPAALVIRSAEG